MIADGDLDRVMRLRREDVARGDGRNATPRALGAVAVTPVDRVRPRRGVARGILERRVELERSACRYAVLPRDRHGHGPWRRRRGRWRRIRSGITAAGCREKNECEKAAPDSGARGHRAAMGPDCHGYVPPESRGVALGSMGVLGEGGGVAAGAGTAGFGSGWRGPPHALPSAISAIPRMRASSLTGGAFHHVP